MKISSLYNKYYGVSSRELIIDEPKLFCEQSDDLISEIFAPSPLNGFPTNALSLVLSKNTAREVQEFVKDNLLQMLPSRPGAPDDETAEKTMQINSEQYGEEIDAYYNRLTEFVQSVESEIKVENE